MESFVCCTQNRDNKLQLAINVSLQNYKMGGGGGGGCTNYITMTSSLVILNIAESV